MGASIPGIKFLQVSSLACLIPAGLVRESKIAVLRDVLWRVLRVSVRHWGNDTKTGSEPLVFAAVRKILAWKGPVQPTSTVISAALRNDRVVL